MFISGFGYQSELELRVAEAVKRQYNKLKMQTKAEIRQSIDQLLVGEFIVRYFVILLLIKRRQLVSSILKDFSFSLFPCRRISSDGQ